MLQVFRAPLAPLKYEDLKGENTLELRAEILNHRLLDSYYAQLRMENIDEFRRIREANS